MKTFSLHAGLFLATCLSTFFVFRDAFDGGVVGDDVDKWWGSFLYAAVVMLILTAHEMGHFLMARAHGVDSSWPYFLPLPLGFGTLGAVIRLKGRIPTRDALVDIGAAGPLAGLLIAVPMLFVGAALSSVERLPDDVNITLPPTMSLLHLASDLGLWLKSEFFGGAAPALPRYQLFGDNLLTLLAVRVTHGALPPGTDLIAHPVFLAAWFGLVMTMLNLLPVGQLDGGHLTHDRARAARHAGTRGRHAGRREQRPQQGAHQRRAARQQPHSSSGAVRTDRSPSRRTRHPAKIPRSLPSYPHLPTSLCPTPPAAPLAVPPKPCGSTTMTRRCCASAPRSWR